MEVVKEGKMTNKKMEGKFRLAKDILPECPMCGNPRYFGNGDVCEVCGQHTDVFFDEDGNVNQLARDRYGCWD
jgi:hypothetical protein